MESLQTYNHSDYSYWRVVAKQYCKRVIGVIALGVVALFALVGLYAPFLASSKPLIVNYDGHLYFPLFRYLFYSGFFTKPIDIFYNILMFVFPLACLGMLIAKNHRKTVLIVAFLAQPLIFAFILIDKPLDPAGDPALTLQRKEVLAQAMAKAHGQMPPPSWAFDLKYLNEYAKLNLLLDEKISYQLHQNLVREILSKGTSSPIPSVWAIRRQQEEEQLKRLETIVDDKKQAFLDAQQQLAAGKPLNAAQHAAVKEYQEAQAQVAYIQDKREWIDENLKKVQWMVMPLLRPLHWEDDAAGTQAFNQQVDWWNLTRINRKDLVAALIFGTRISLVVGVTAVVFALIIGIPIGAVAGFFGGKWDLLICRLMEIWEAMPIFFMLLFVVAITQSKSIFLVISVLGIFGWIGIARFIRGEILKQRNLTYVEACHSLGFKNARIIFSHILPNAIPPVLTLLPFAIMGAIVAEAGLSFLGLGEEGSSSWGVLMDEGRAAFPAESYLLWPPALLLTILLVAIAIVGDTLRDALDPKMR